MTSSPNRRRRLIVNPAVQSRIIVNISWPTAAALAFVALLLGWFSMRLLDEAMMAKVELPSLIPVLVTVIGFLVVSFGYLVFNALKFSHRIAGPMYRLRKTLETATEGDYSVRANLRTHDFLVEVADSLNEFLAHLELKEADLAGDGPQGRGEKPMRRVEEMPALPGMSMELGTAVEAGVGPDTPGSEGSQA